MRWLIDTPLAAGDPGLKFYLAVNIALFVILLAMRSALSGGAEPSLFALVVYSGLLLATGASMAFVAAPPSFWRRLVKLAPVEIVLAFAGAGVAVGIGRLAQRLAAVPGRWAERTGHPGHRPACLSGRAAPAPRPEHGSADS